MRALLVHLWHFSIAANAMSEAMVPIQALQHVVVHHCSVLPEDLHRSVIVQRVKPPRTEV